MKWKHIIFCRNNKILANIYMFMDSFLHRIEKKNISSMFTNVITTTRKIECLHMK